MQTFTRSRLLAICLALLLGVPACSPPGRIAAAPTAVAVVPTAIGPPTVSPTQAGPGTFAVQILNPSPGAQLPAGQPVRVQFTASGGPFMEAHLWADGATVDYVRITSPDPRFEGTLQWKDPTPGAHKLVVGVLNPNKEMAQAELQVQVGPGGPGEVAISPSSGVPSAGGMQVRFVNLTDGGTATTAPGENGKPVVVVVVEASGATAFGVGLVVDGVYVQGVNNKTGTIPFRAEFQWSPARGGGTYTLVASAASADKQAFAQQQVRVTVTGIPTFTPTPPPLDKAAARQRMIGLYQQVFGLKLTAPALARFQSSAPDYAQWVSVAYVGDMMYEIDLFDDTHYETHRRPIGHPIPGEGPICRPAGVYRILVVLVDYGNLGLTREEALAALQRAAAAANQRFADYATAHKLASPVMRLEVSGQYLSPPPAPGQFLNWTQVRSLTGADPKQFDFLAQVDLDANQTTSKSLAERGIEAGGLAMEGCGEMPRSVNLWVEVTRKDSLDDNLSYTLLDHELNHLMGWGHNWPCGDGSGMEAGKPCPPPTLPTLLFGWEDTDGDGVVEILDPTPYGLVKP